MANTVSEQTATGRRFRGLEAEERQSLRRQKLLEAGLELFGTHGFHAVGVRDICAQAKLTERYFYESFKNLDALFVGVYQLAVDRVRFAVTEALRRAPSNDGATMSRAALRASLELYRSDRRLARILLIDVLTTGLGDTSRGVSEPYINLIEQLTFALHPELKKHRIDVRMIAHGLYGSTISIAMYWALGGFRESLEHVLDHCEMFYAAMAHERERRIAPAHKDQAKDAPKKRKPKRKG